MTFRPFAWFHTLHSKLFLVTALVTSVLTVAVAFSITRNSRRELEKYSRNLSIETSQAVETEILQRWNKDFHDFKDPQKIKELLESLAGPDRSIFQIDVFRRLPSSSQVALVASCEDEDKVEWGKEIGSHMEISSPQSELVELTTGTRAWKIYLPIRNLKPKQPPVRPDPHLLRPGALGDGLGEQPQQHPASACPWWSWGNSSCCGSSWARW